MYDKDLPLVAKNLPHIKLEKGFIFADDIWKTRVKSAEQRLKRKARPFTELEDSWEKYLEYAKCVSDCTCWTQSQYLQKQRLAMASFAKRITPRVQLIYARTFNGSERGVFFDALNREILSWNRSPKK